jgi:hypothetical protein
MPGSGGLFDEVLDFHFRRERNFGAEGGTRTRMSVARHPLKMVCLPDSTTSAFFSPRRHREKGLKNWNDGRLEYWENEFFIHHSIIPSFHYSSIPYFVAG